jgi:type IV secretory pathway TrbD component
MAKTKELGVFGALIAALVILGIAALIANYFGLLPSF